MEEGKEAEESNAQNEPNASLKKTKKSKKSKRKEKGKLIFKTFPKFNLNFTSFLLQHLLLNLQKRRKQIQSSFKYHQQVLSNIYRRLRARYLLVRIEYITFTFYNYR
jgi:hypothetical protein